MASTSASSVQKSFKYDVFLSFRGEDTRKTFVDHLCHALQQKGITTYKDDERIEKGERISDQLITSIEDSRFHIIVFSKNYASSSWCLDELVKIMECQKRMEQTAYPVFYDVEPTEVRNQSGAIGEAFEEHVEKEAAERWREALKEAAGLAGWELKNTLDGHEAKFIQKIIIDISLKLSFINQSIDENLVGIKTRLEVVVSSLEIDSDDVRMIGIKGIGGGGKTTLAATVFDHISIWFEGISFVENVRELSKSSLSGLKDLQKQVLSDVLNDQSIVIKCVSDGKNKMKKMMGCRKVLIVLDDVDNIGQLEALAGNPNWFKAGSRIIITTRDEQLLVAHRVNFIHDVNMLSHEEAICLFSRYAFGREIPIQGYEELSTKVVHYAAGLPLTIKVLGSHLCGKSEREWVDALERLKTIPLKETLEKLELSYNGLENDQKEIFLDVACLLKGIKKKKAIRILESCGFHAKFGLRVLEQKSLLTISNDDRLLLHDHLEEMGKNIVRRFYPDEPNKHSRLWIEEEIEDILVNDLGTKATRSIKMGHNRLYTTIRMKGPKKCLKKMTKLRLLYVDGRGAIQNFDEVIAYLPNTLRSLHWSNCPIRCLPKTFQANTIVNLEMVGSNISQLWEGGEIKVLNNLRFLFLDRSNLRTFDFRMTPNLQTLSLKECLNFVQLNMLDGCPHLETLNVEQCCQFVEFHMTVVCPKLKFLKLGGSELSSLNLGLAPNLESLYLDRMNPLFEIHMTTILPNLKYLNLNYAKVSSLNLGLTPNLEKLIIGECYDFVELHMPVECPNLKYLNLSYCEVSSLNLGLTPNLEELCIKDCYCFVELHMPVECPKLKYLSLIYSKVSKLNLGLIPNLEELSIRSCYDFIELHVPVDHPKLKSLELNCYCVNNLNLGLTPNLETLDLTGCSDFVELHIPFECPMLKSLNLGGSKVSNLNLGLTPHLKRLDLRKCYCLQEIHAPVGCLAKLVFLNLSGCLRFEHFYVDKGITFHGHDSLAKLELMVESVDVCPLHPNNNLPKFQFKCKYDEPLPSSSGNLEKLISFGLCACTNLESFSKTICHLQRLRVLKIEGGIPEVPKDMCQLESLEELTLWMKEIKQLPYSICMLKHLKYLNLKSCWLLEQLPKDLGRLECLKELILTECIQLRDIPDNICKMKSLMYLDLSYCILVEKLPEEFGHLEHLMKLNIEGAGISRLPQSIFQFKGLQIIGSRWRLESFGFTSLRNISRYTASTTLGTHGRS